MSDEVEWVRFPPEVPCVEHSPIVGGDPLDPYVICDVCGLDYSERYGEWEKRIYRPTMRDHPNPIGPNSEGVRDPLDVESRWAIHHGSIITTLPEVLIDGRWMSP